MSLVTFLVHFLYIGGTFAGGVVVGWLTYNKVVERFSKKAQKDKL